MLKINILLSTYNGERYLKEQLDSLFSQTYKNFKIIVRDDGSNDRTMDILKHYDIELLDSHENIGVEKSFLTLLEYALKYIDSGYFMFCDQDDVWEKDKVEKTLQKMCELESKHEDMPLLVHTDLKVVDEKLQLIHNSFLKNEHINPQLNSFNRLLMQNTITGCTMMINRRLAELSLPLSNGIIMHDWWMGLVASKFGKIGFVNNPLILYRQHANNSIGAKNFTLEYVLNKVFEKEIISKNIIQANIFLNQYRNRLDKRTIIMLEEVTGIENKSFLRKRIILLKYGLFKHGFIRNIGLFIKL